MICTETYSVITENLLSTDNLLSEFVRRLLASVEINMAVSPSVWRCINSSCHEKTLHLPAVNRVPEVCPSSVMLQSILPARLASHCMESTTRAVRSPDSRFFSVPCRFIPDIAVIDQAVGTLKQKPITEITVAPSHLEEQMLLRPSENMCYHP